MDDNFEQKLLEETTKAKLISFCFFVAFVMILVFSYFFCIHKLADFANSRMTDYDNISKYVLENSDILVDFIYKYKDNKDIELPKNVHNVRICDLGEDNFGVQFITWGFLDNCAGFIYSTTGKPFRENCEQDNIVAREDGSLEWVERSNSEEFKEINDNWYYWHTYY